MPVKFIGIALVLGACTVLGIYYSLKDGFRIADLTELKKALLLLKGEIEFSHNPLPEAMLNIAERLNNRLAGFFKKLSAFLLDGKGTNVADVWKCTVKQEFHNLHFNGEDIQNTERLGETLGHISKHVQAEGLEMAVLYIDGQVERLRENEMKNKRLYRSAGTIFGILIVIILI